MELTDFWTKKMNLPLSYTDKSGRHKLHTVKLAHIKYKKGVPEYLCLRIAGS